MPVAAVLSISADQIGYQWFSEKGKQRHTATLRWTDIAAVAVFKRDLFTYDLICVQLQANAEEPVEFDEEDPNWMELVSALPVRLPGCRSWREWFPDVAFPAFEPKLQKVFERNERD